MAPDASFFLNITGSSSRPWLPFELMVRLRGLFQLQNHITWVKSISVGEDSLGHFKPIRSDRFLHRNHEHIFHLTRSGNVPIKRLAVGVPYKDKSNIARRNHQQDLRCRGDTWFIPYSTVQAKAQKFNHPASFPVLLPRMCIRLHGKAAAGGARPVHGQRHQPDRGRGGRRPWHRHRSRRRLCRSRAQPAAVELPRRPGRLIADPRRAACLAHSIIKWRNTPHRSGPAHRNGCFSPFESGTGPAVSHPTG